MKVWLIRDLEPLPTDPDGQRPLRAGLLAEAFAARGHETTWITSTFNHYSRRQRPAGRFRVADNLTIEVLPCPGYRGNMSIGRVLHNRRFARAFRRFAETGRVFPDVLVTDLPTTEAAQAVVSFGVRARIPTVLSIRDLWPDFFSDFVPSPLRPLMRLVSRPLDRQARFACRHADSLIGISKRYLEWGQAKGERGASDRDRVFPLGFRRPNVPGHAEAEALLRRLGVPADKHIVSFVGSWGVTYDLALVLAAARLLSKREDIVFAIAGDGSTQPDLESAFRQIPNVVLPGWLGPDEVAALLSRSAIGLLPYARSAPQGLPNKLYEYMAFGVLQIATLAGEAETLYEETGTGRSIASASPESLAGAIESALADTALIEGRDRRIAVFDARFEADEIYSAMVDHIADVVTGHGT